jgi:hypothetical protein
MVKVKERIIGLFAAIALSLPGIAGAATWDLATAWSNTTNPNGVWTYVVAGNTAQAGTRTGDVFADPPGPPVIWSEGSADTFMGWSKSNGSESGLQLDLAVGDIYGHTPNNSSSATSIEIDWTSPVSGQIEINGGVWLLRDVDRSVNWSLTLGSTTLDSGTLFSGDPYSRSSPDNIYALLNVSAGDIVRFQAWSADTGDYVGLDLTIEKNDNFFLNFQGSGNGTVTGNGIRNGSAASFTTNIGTTEQFDIGSILHLHGDPDDYNIFTGWSGDCSGKTDCSLTMTASSNVNAIFDIYTDHKTRIGDTQTYYSALQAAYVNSPNPGIIKAWATDYVENLICDQAKNVTLEGGYNEDYTSNTGHYTTLKGNLTVAAGSFTCEKFVISACNNGNCNYHSISGKITYNGTGLSGVSVRLSGASASLITTDSNGNYSFTGLSNGTYTVTPSLAGYIITPKQGTVSDADVALNFTATTPSYDITGRVTYNGAGLSGVAVSLTGAGTANTTTDSNGNYSFTGLYNGKYTVTPTLAGYTILPKQATINNASVALNFTATYGYSITGRITLSGTGFSGVAVTLSGANNANTTTDTNGNYSFNGLSNGTYTITPSLTGYLFTPANLSATVSNANVTGRNFTATLNSITHPSSLVGTWSTVDHYTEDSDGEAPYTETGSGTLNADGTTNNGTGAWAVYKNIMAAGDFYNEVDGKGISCNYLTSVNSPLSGYFEEIDLDYYWWGRGTGTATKINSSGGSDQLHLHPANLVGNWSVVATYTSTSSGTPNSYNSTETVTLNSNGTVSSRDAVIGFWFSEGDSVGDVFGVGYFWDKAAESGFKFTFMNLLGTTSTSGYIEDKKLTGSLWWGRGNVSMTKQ